MPRPRGGTISTNLACATRLTASRHPPRHGVPTRRIRVIEAGIRCPTRLDCRPDEQFALAQEADSTISCWCCCRARLREWIAPADGVVAQKQQVTRALLRPAPDRRGQ